MHRTTSRKLSFLGGVALIASFGASSAARADIILTLTDVGNPSGSFSGTIATGSPTDNGGAGISSTPFTGQFGDFLYSNALAGESQSLTSPVIAQAIESSLDITNTTGSTKTLMITIQATNFTAPMTPPNLSLVSSFSGTDTLGTGSASFQSSVGTLGANSPGVQTLSPVGFSFSNTDFGSVSSLSAPYSIFETLTLTLVAGEQINYTARTDIAGSVPEPAAMVITATGLPLLVMFMALHSRRRRAMAR